MEKEYELSKKNHVEYKIKVKANIDNFPDYKSLANAVRQALPNEDEFDIYTHLHSSYLEKNKGERVGKKNIVKGELTIKIAIGNTKNHEEESIKIKENLEKILGTELNIIREKD